MISLVRLEIQKLFISFAFDLRCGIAFYDLRRKSEPVFFDSDFRGRCAKRQGSSSV